MDFTKSIMTLLATWFGKPEATEAELHSELSDISAKGTFADIISGAGLAELQSQLNTLNERTTATEANVTQLQAQLTERDATIADLQTQVEAANQEIADRKAAIAKSEADLVVLQSAHDTKVADLAGQIAALKAGKSLEKQEEGAHAATTLKQHETQVDKVIPILDSKLRANLGLN
jgi:septal ring factor EnvC (AmiA/AmiB activator)